MASFKKIFGPTRVDCTSAGGLKTYKLPASTGGQTARTAQYMILILEASSTFMQVGLVLEHGPDGQNFLTHSTPIATAAVAATYPEVKSGDADQTKILGAWLRAVLHADSSDANAQWAQVEVYELLKDF